MTKQGTGASRIAYLVVVAAVFVWGILGIADMPAATYTGYATTAQNVVNQVQPGSPAEAAGLMVGDEITSIAGIPVEDVRALNRLPRTVPGTVREIGVMRDGQAVTVSLTFASLPGGQSAIAWAAVVLGLLFLFMPFLARSKARSDSSRYLAWFGACFALSFMAGPYLSSPALRNLAGAVTVAAIVLGFALLLRFVLSFPQDRMAAAGQSARLLIWAPAAIIAAMFAYLFIAEPAATSSLNTVVNLLVALFVIGYFGAALFVLFGKYRAASPEQRAATGLSLVFWGAVVGLVPPLLATVLNLLAPMVVLPGQQYYFLTLGLIPVLFSVAVMKSSSTHAAAAT